MKGFEAIKAMERGECVKSCHGFIVRRDGNYLQKWYKPESCWHTYSAAITMKQLLSDDWQIVSDPSKPPRYVAHMTCACCNAEIQSGGLVCSACMAKAKPKQEPEPYTVKTLPHALKQCSTILGSGQSVSAYQDFAACLLNEARRIAREEVERGKI